MHNKIIQFYDLHPINYNQITSSLENKYKQLKNITQEQLSDFDQDHYDGSEAIDILAHSLDIKQNHHVLDIGCGVGGASRYLAYHYGCQVFGLDITQSRIEAAIKLTELSGLSHLVKFQQGDATSMPFSNHQFDRIIGQEAWVHIADKKSLFNECRRVLKPEGKLGFTDVIVTNDLTSQELLRLQQEMACYGLITANEYENEIKRGNFILSRKEDLSIHWMNILVERLKMYRSLKEHTIKKFGEEYYLQWDETYAFYVDLFTKGKLGGMRFIAHR
ncbi:class I SAM-dependent methyltransferase [Legionella jamestowniensis]|uniref:SAM dependent methyltransferase n=1 Tax=Legionella jamestowniensis TaxID=455 RepID=A0A0W0UH27_9GAMM|nr:class I SAM-dependent methyltransferase [Legionella jamestowniensis]KTD07155.1 SAM dependent methyltransferase [Legionella jamestowniensis]OCH98894.1 hypothetical protein A8135_09025 [Legionella jamestowniensis]SFL71677.1 Cyclopropane fatty-acyl-phospholipid synthase [Legionella jamestowniensis DSM 19215]